MTQEEKIQALERLRAEMETNQTRLQNAEQNVTAYLEKLRQLTVEFGDLLAEPVSE